MTSEQEKFEQLRDSIATRLKHAGITEAMLQATLPGVREQLMRERYPDLFADTKEGSRSRGTPRTKRKMKNKKEPK